MAQERIRERVMTFVVTDNCIGCKLRIGLS